MLPSHLDISTSIGLMFLLLRGKIPFSILSVRIFKVLLMFPFLISFENFPNIFAIFERLLFKFILFQIVSASLGKLMILLKPITRYDVLRPLDDLKALIF